MSIFGKQKPAGKSPSPRQEIISQPAASPVTIVSRGTVIHGEISSGDMLQVDGHVEGNIAVKNKVVIGGSGRITADITASAIQVYGKIIGDVVATDRVTIENTGSVEGNIRSPKLMISEGAHFRGNIDMSQKTEIKNMNIGGGDTKEKKFDLQKDLGIQSAQPTPGS